MQVNIIGLGKLGTPFAALLADAGHSVVGYDTNPQTVELLSEHKTPVSERGLVPLLQKVAKSSTPLSAAMSPHDLHDTQDTVSFIIVPTPSDSTNKFDASLVEAVIDELVKCCKPHTICVVSTIMPGTSASIIESLPDGWEYVYSPEFIALGSVIENMQAPDVRMIGASSPRGAQRVIDALTPVYARGKKSPAIEISDPTSVEIAKISVNTFITMKIAYTHMIKDIVERVNGGNTLDIVRMIGRDTRIGAKYLHPGTAFGGPCFPRDTRAIQTLTVFPLPSTIEGINKAQSVRLAEQALQHMPYTYSEDYFSPRNGKALIVGMSYKPQTHVLDESASVCLAEELIKLHVNVECWDANKDVDVAHLHIPRRFDDLADIVDEYRIVYLMHPFVVDANFAELHKDTVFVDPWHTLPKRSNVMHV